MDIFVTELHRVTNPVATRSQCNPSGRYNVQSIGDGWGSGGQTHQINAS